MADSNNASNSSLAFIVGGLVVAVGVMVYFFYDPGTGKQDINIKLDVPEVIVPAPKSGD